MVRRPTNLYPAIANFQALRTAARRAILGKRKKPGAAAFMARLEQELLRLERELTTETYRPGRYVEILVRDPKERLVSAAPFRDRVVHHALMGVVGPILDAGLIDNTFANRTGKGTHLAVETYERYRNRHAHVLRCDIYRYFPSIDHALLKRELRRRIACLRTLALMDLIIDSSNPQEPVDLHFPGDDLFAPYERRRGLPIGNLTSQCFANLYLDRLDHFVTEVLGAAYVRYVDDFAVFHDCPATLADWQQRIARHLEGRRLRLHPRKTVILPTAEPATFLGYTLAPVDPSHRSRRGRTGWRRLPDDNVRRFRGRLRGLRDRWRAGTIETTDIEARVGAWIAHANNADTWQLQRELFAGGWFDPLSKLRKP